MCDAARFQTLHSPTSSYKIIRGRCLEGRQHNTLLPGWSDACGCIAWTCPRGALQDSVVALATGLLVLHLYLHDYK